jgi:hypothetical protein
MRGRNMGKDTKRNIIGLILLSLFAVSCSMSTSDDNPSPTAITSAKITGGNLTLGGSGLNNVTSLALTQGSSPTQNLGPITTRTASLLTTGLPAVLILPGMLLASTANATNSYPLSSLTTLDVTDLNVTGTATFTGAVTLGYQPVSAACGPGAGVCPVSCPAGTQILGGGCQIVPASVGMSSNFPSTATQWICQPAAAATSTTAFAMCAKIQ